MRQGFVYSRVVTCADGLLCCDVDSSCRWSGLMRFCVLQMVIGQQSSGSSNLTELQVVNLDASQNAKSDS